jgi:hypothetical protein
MRLHLANVEAQPLIFVSVSVTDRPSCPIASSVRIVLAFVSLVDRSDDPINAACHRPK